MGGEPFGIVVWCYKKGCDPDCGWKGEKRSGGVL